MNQTAVTSKCDKMIFEYLVSLIITLKLNDSNISTVIQNDYVYENDKWINCRSAFKLTEYTLPLLVRYV